jgi:acetylornithine deacetylase/succinyl-diaminopimelate desuccinylase-like protein
VFDGEEEIGSLSLMRGLAAHVRDFTADVAVVSDRSMLDLYRPALTEPLCGLPSMEIEMLGAPTDLHSGLFGSVDNPLHTPCKLLADLHTDDEPVALPGFYDHVRALSPYKQAYTARAGLAAKNIPRAVGVTWRASEPRFMPYERGTIRPALTIASIVGGHAGSGEGHHLDVRPKHA